MFTGKKEPALPEEEPARETRPRVPDLERQVADLKQQVRGLEEQIQEIGQQNKDYQVRIKFQEEYLSTLDKVMIRQVVHLSEGTFLLS